MQNSRDKKRDIARSVLPSTMGVSARRRSIHKAERALVRRSIRTRDTDDDLCFDAFERVAQRYIGEMVQERRGADHVGRLIRWARHHAHSDRNLIDATHEDRLAHFASVLPNNLAGRHALTHIDYALRHRSNRAGKHRSDAHDEHLDKVRAALLVILRAGCHGELNRRIRGTGVVLSSAGRCSPLLDRPRLLLGQHDITAFAEATAHNVHAYLAIRFANELLQSTARALTLQSSCLSRRRRRNTTVTTISWANHSTTTTLTSSRRNKRLNTAVTRTGRRPPRLKV